MNYQQTSLGTPKRGLIIEINRGAFCIKSFDLRKQLNLSCPEDGAYIKKERILVFLYLKMLVFYNQQRLRNSARLIFLEAISVCYDRFRELAEVGFLN